MVTLCNKSPNPCPNLLTGNPKPGVKPTPFPHAIDTQKDPERGPFHVARSTCFRALFNRVLALSAAEGAAPEEIHGLKTCHRHVFSGRCAALYGLSSPVSQKEKDLQRGLFPFGALDWTRTSGLQSRRRRGVKDGAGFGDYCVGNRQVRKG